MNLNKQKLIDLKSEISINDRPILIREIIDDTDEWIVWDDVGACLQNPGSTDTLYLNKTKSINEHVSAVRFKLHSNFKKMQVEFGGNQINTTQFVDADEILRSLRTIIISNFEHVKPVFKELQNYMINLFYLKLDGHGVWPAQLNNYSGSAHVYCGLKDSNWYHPRCDGPNNFIFQMQGKQKLTLYNNRATALGNVELDPLDTEKERAKLYKNLEIMDELEMNAGDMVYIPHRQFYHLTHIENTLSVNMPLMLTGPLTVAY